MVVHGPPLQKKKTFAFGTVRVSSEVFSRRVTMRHMRLSVLDHSDMPLVLFGNLICIHRPWVTLTSLVEVTTRLQLYLTTNRGSALIL